MRISTIALAGVAGLCLAGAAVAAEREKAEAKPVLVEFVPVRYVPVELVRVRQVDPFLQFDRMMAAMQTRHVALMRQAAMLAAQARADAGDNPVIAFDRAAAGNLPPGGYSITYVSTSNGGRTCGQMVQVTARQGAAPQRISRSFGDCSEGATPAPQPAAPAQRTPVLPTI